MSLKRTSNLPKYISQTTSGKYAVKIFYKPLDKIIYIGSYETLIDSVRARNEWILNNPSAGCMPRGVSKSHKKYQARISFNNKKISLGVFDTIEEAVKYRTEVLLGLL